MNLFGEPQTEEHCVKLATERQKLMETEIKKHNLETRHERQFVEEEITFRELAKRIGIEDLNTPEIYNIEHEKYEILSYDHESKQEVWKPLKTFVVKQNADEHYQANTLHGTKDHKIFVDGEYIRLEDYIGAEQVQHPIQVVDCEVEDTHNYIAEGFINHNTTTPGGMAIPYASSVRVRISSTGQQQIKDNAGNVIGIKVKAKTIKNRVARPFRTCEFQIIFGVGVVEHEEVFDLFRAHCTEVIKQDKDAYGVVHNGKSILVAGTAAWKTFTVTDQSTGEILVEEKFYKPNFNRVLYNPAYQEYVDALYTDALVMQRDAKEHLTFAGVNKDSVEEAEALKAHGK